MNDQRAQFRDLLNRKQIITAPGAFDPLSAMVIEQSGFSAVYLTGGGMSRSYGFPDLGLMTMDENRAAIARVCDAVAIPVIADADTGYGNALNVARTVREFERTGVAAFHLEDQITPKRCGHYDGKEVVPIGEMIGKIKAALDARRDERLTLIARTDSRAALGLDRAIERGNLYAEAGADVVFVEAPRSIEELKRIVNEIEAPSMTNMIKGSRTPLLSPDELEKIGFKIAIFPNDVHRAAIWAVRECVNHMRKFGTTETYDAMIDFDAREEIVGTAQWLAMAEKYADRES
ncbi:MAG: isocitrate lyase/PEP mutase family protein [SAR324 cluster bacterium]|nr:isocitrate lyase/PEP mutase family protein [SAR324 cluster bacterium]